MASPYDPFVPARPPMAPPGYAPPTIPPGMYAPSPATDPFGGLPNRTIPTNPVVSEAADAASRVRAALSGTAEATDPVARARAAMGGGGRMGAVMEAMGAAGRGVAAAGRFAGPVAEPAMAAGFLWNAIDPGERTRLALEEGRRDIASRDGLMERAGAFARQYVGNVVPTAIWEGTGARAAAHGIRDFVRGITGAPPRAAPAAGGAQPVPAPQGAVPHPTEDPRLMLRGPNASAMPQRDPNAIAAFGLTNRELDMIGELPNRHFASAFGHATSRPATRRDTGADRVRDIGLNMVMQDLTALEQMRAENRITPEQFQQHRRNSLSQLVSLVGGNPTNMELAEQMGRAGLR